MNNLIQNKLDQLHEYRVKLCIKRDKKPSWAISQDIASIDSVLELMATKSIIVNISEKDWLVAADIVLNDIRSWYPDLF